MVLQHQKQLNRLFCGKESQQKAILPYISFYKHQLFDVTDLINLDTHRFFSSENNYRVLGILAQENSKFSTDTAII